MSVLANTVGSGQHAMMAVARPISVLVRHLHAAGATPAMVEQAVAEMETELAWLRAEQQSGFGKNPTVAPQNPTVGTETVAQPSVSDFKPDGEMRAWADPWALAKKHDPMVMRRAIETRKGLTRKQRAVGIAIVAFYNRKTGRCDPSATKIAARAGCNRATVFEAIKALGNAALIMRKSYGGDLHSNAYALGWDSAARQLTDAQPSDFESRQPSESDTNPVYINSTSRVPGSSVAQKRRRSKAHPDQKFLLLPVPGGLGREAFKATPEVLRQKATERLWPEWVKRHGGRLKPDPEAWEAAIQAEIRVHRSGLAAHDQFVLGQLERRRTGAGPPG